MGDVSSTSTYTEAVTGLGAKLIIVETANTVDTADTLTVTGATYGVTSFLAITGYVHTTEGSVIVEEAPTTTVSAGVMTITVGGSTVSNKKRVYMILAK